MLTAEKYSRGRRGAPAKGVGRATGARVQIPLSPFFLTGKRTYKNTAFKKVKKKIKKLLTTGKTCDNINELLLKTEKQQTNLENQRLNSM